MSLLLKLSGLALRQVVNGALRYLGHESGQAAVEPVVTFLTTRFTDPSQRLTVALRDATEEAWRAVEASLAVDSLWSRICLAVSSGDVRGFRARVLDLLEGLAPKERLGLSAEEFRDLCRQDLQRARQDGILTRGNLDALSLAQRAGHFAAFGSTDLLAAEWRSIEDLGHRLLAEGYPYLGRFVLLREEDWPLLALSVRYFLSKRLEREESLFRQVMLQREGGLTPSQRGDLSEMHTLLVAHGARLDELLTLGEANLVVSREILGLTRDSQATTKQTLEAVQALVELLRARALVPEVHPIEVIIETIPEVPVVEVPDPEPVGALAVGESLPEVPPRYSREMTATEENKQVMKLRADLWTTNPTLANPGALVREDPQPSQEKLLRSILGGAFQQEGETSTEETATAEPSEPVCESEPPRRFGIPGLFDS